MTSEATVCQGSNPTDRRSLWKLWCCWKHPRITQEICLWSLLFRRKVFRKMCLPVDPWARHGLPSLVWIPLTCPVPEAAPRTWPWDGDVGLSQVGLLYKFFRLGGWIQGSIHFATQDEPRAKVLLRITPATSNTGVAWPFIWSLPALCIRAPGSALTGRLPRWLQNNTCPTGWALILQHLGGDCPQATTMGLPCVPRGWHHSTTPLWQRGPHHLFWTEEVTRQLLTSQEKFLVSKAIMNCASLTESSSFSQPR